MLNEAMRSLMERVRTAHGDAWQAEGCARFPYGGGVARVRGARLMASGIPTPKWNNADITSGDPDLEAITAWYADRDQPWGLRVPVELDIALGQPILVKRCFGLQGLRLDRVALPGVEIRLATPSELDAYVRVDAEAFREDPALSRRWVEPTLGRPGFDHWLAIAGAEVVGVAEVVATDDEAGPAAMLAGIGVRSDWEGRGVQLLLAERAVEHALENGAHLIHAHDEDQGLCEALGFVQVPGFQIRVVRP